jgi:iron complex transport system ATP-binding protein
MTTAVVPAAGQNAVNTPLLDVRGLTLGARLCAASFQLAPGEMLGLIGPNGAGKSTLLQCLAGIATGTGEAQLGGQPLAALPRRERARRIGWLPQTQTSAWALRVQDVVALGRLPWGDRDADTGRQAIAQAMTQTGIATLAARPVNALSGGEQARVWLARALAGQPRLLLADEPIASLDLKHQRAALETLRGYAGAGRGVILAIHDLGLAARWCDRLCLLQAGRLRAIGAPPQVLTEALLTEVFDAPVHVDLDADPPVVVLK